MKTYYIIHVDDYNALDQNYVNLQSPIELDDETFKEICGSNGHVLSEGEFVAMWNNDTLPCIDSYLRIF